MAEAWKNKLNHETVSAFAQSIKSVYDVFSIDEFMQSTMDNWDSLELRFLAEDKYVDFTAPNIQSKAYELFNGIEDDILDGRWIKIDARGNKAGVDARFSLDKPILAFPCRSEYDEYLWRGIYAAPHIETMQMLEQAKNLHDVIENIPDMITENPDIECFS